MEHGRAALAAVAAGAFDLLIFEFGRMQEKGAQLLGVVRDYLSLREVPVVAITDQLERDAPSLGRKNLLCTLEQGILSPMEVVDVALSALGLPNPRYGGRVIAASELNPGTGGRNTGRFTPQSVVQDRAA